MYFFMKKIITLIVILMIAMPAYAEKSTPAWKLQDETIYSIMIDRFNNANQSNDGVVDFNNPNVYHGGDFLGITKQLEYIKEMGFTTILLTPIFKNASNDYKGEAPVDFYKTNERFGTMEDFKTLVNEAHKQDIKIMLEMVVNHTGKNHPWLKDATKKDWFHPQKKITTENQTDLENGWLHNLPDLNQDNKAVSTELINIAKWWIKEANVDAYYVRNVNNVPKTFWTEFTKEVKSTKKDFFILGEVSKSDRNYTASYQDTGIDGFMNIPFNKEAPDLFKVTDKSLKSMYEVFEQDKKVYKHPELLATFLDNQDTDRFTRLSVENRQNPKPRFRMGLSYMFMTPGIPVVYYGTEVPLDGSKKIIKDFPHNQRSMDFMEKTELKDHITQQNLVRSLYPALRYGSFEMMYEKDGMAVFKRVYEDQVMFVAVNNTTKTQKVELKDPTLVAGKELAGNLKGNLTREEDGKFEIIVDREETEVYLLQDKTGLNIPLISFFLIVMLAFVGFVIKVSRNSKEV